MKEDNKAARYHQLMLEYDKVAWKVSQLKSTNAGINLSEEILIEVGKLEQQQINIEREAMILQQGL